jgi:hypothetical protein
MDTDNDYPSILYGELPMFARLLTAIHVACVDAGGECFGVKYDDEDLQRFFDVNGHRYFSVEPTGGIKKAASSLTKAVLASVEKGELKLAKTRRNLAGDLSLRGSWVEADAFDEWCNSHGLSLGESWFDLWKDDQEICSAAAEIHEVKRRQYEGLNDESDVESIREQFETGGVDALFAEIATLRAKLKRHESKDARTVQRPIQNREKTTYLNIIGAMLELMKSPRPGRDSDTAVIDEIERNYRDKPGISTRTLQEKFAAAKRSLSAS